MKSITITEIPLDFNWQGEIEIKKLREDLDKLEELGATSIDIDLPIWGDPWIQVKAYSRIESNKRKSAQNK